MKPLKIFLRAESFFKILCRKKMGQSLRTDLAIAVGPKQKRSPLLPGHVQIIQKNLLDGLASGLWNVDENCGMPE